MPNIDSRSGSHSRSTLPVCSAAVALVVLTTSVGCASTRPASPRVGEASSRPSDASTSAPPPVTAEDCGGAFESTAAGAAEAAAVRPTDARYVELGESALRARARDRAKECFDAALSLVPESPRALYGLGAVAADEGDQRTAIAMFGRAVAADPAMTPAWIALREAELRHAEELLARAGNSVEAGASGAGSPSRDAPAAVARPVVTETAARHPVAVGGLPDAPAAERVPDRPEAAYRSAIELAPRILPPYLHLADGLARSGDDVGAVEVLERARRYIGDNPAVLQALSAAYSATGDTANAVAAAERFVEVAPERAGGSELLERARRRHERATLPASFRDLSNRPEITRQELAGLLAMRLPEAALTPQPGTRDRPPTDLGDAWAAEHIRRVTAAGVMEVFANHTFAPDLIVTRGMLADVLYRALHRGGAIAGPPRAARITDVPQEHLGYDAIRSVVGYDLMSLDDRGRFHILDVARGREVVDAVERLRGLLR